MHITKIARTCTLAGFAPAGRLSHTYDGLLPLLDLFVATLGKLDYGKRARAVLVLCAATAIALPAQTFTTLFSFDGTDGNGPAAALVQATNGDLYGTTEWGGTGCAFNGCGTIFKMTPNGTVTTLYNFCSESGCADGFFPNVLLQATDGDFYGTTFGGGAHISGTVFKITPSGVLTTIYSFCSQNDCTDGSDPNGLVQATNGDFYGTTFSGGTKGANNVYPGTFFKITPSGALTTLYSFCSQGSYPDCPDGLEPIGLIQATNGDFYGTTYQGGAGGGGTVFKITPSGALTTLYTFCSQGGTICPDGQFPYAGLVQATNGDFYGTTSAGGASANCSGCGTVFTITPSGAFTVLHNFCSQTNCTDGEGPEGSLIQATDGNLYGTTGYGGVQGLGNVFKITPSGTLTTLYIFCSQGGTCTDGDSPEAGLIQDTNGNFYGTTPFGANPCPYAGYPGCGTVFSLSIGLGRFVETQTTSGKVGTAVKILGTDLTGATSVSFHGTAAAFTVVSRYLITATVPTGATSGRVEVVTPIGTLSSNVAFRVLP